LTRRVGVADTDLSMRALFNIFVVALVLAGGMICAPDLDAAGHAENDLTDACHDCADWLGCGGCAIRAVTPAAQSFVQHVEGTPPLIRATVPTALQSTADIDHPPRA
jgi:hypothetical protein